MYLPKFPIDRSTRIVTAGSCFAQHIAVRLRQRGYTVLDGEPPPPGLPNEIARDYGYHLYSARYGNIYTARQLLQLVLEVEGRFTPGEIVWEQSGRYFDALRPAVEPDGLDSPQEVLAHRKDHLKRVDSVLRQADLMVFTFGLTEAWLHCESGTVFPTAPETIAGQFDPQKYEFRNFGFNDVVGDFTRVREVLKSQNPGLRFLLTVSPVPLTATASNDHVLVATIASKSILRAAAGQLRDTFEDVDYFPSYEIIATPFLGRFFEPDLRSVSDEGVETVMRVFFASHGEGEMAAPAEETRVIADELTTGIEDRVVCEEVMLETFGA